MVLTPGAHVGPYEVVARIGVGGMGEVYRAIDTTLKRAVAIKVLPAAVAGDAQRLARFEREAEVLASLNHPNIAVIYGMQPWEGGLALVMEFVEGDSLRACVRSLSKEAGRDIARQILAALGAAHRTGVIHRDLKPENIMVRPDGYVKVLDFGLAKWLPSSLQADTARTTLNVSEPGQVLGTVDYMSPEQIQGRDVDGRSDLFAFGIVLHEMLTGQHPWPRSSALDTLHAIVHDESPSIESPRVDAGTATVVQRLLGKRPAERYASAEAVLDALATDAGSQQTTTARRAGPQVSTSIAVLPFVFLNDVGDRRALSLGFADALITIISSLEDVIVAPTSAILNYAAGVEPAQAARELRVRYTLQGTVQKVEEHWRVSIQLFDADLQRITFAETHDFTMDNVFDVQDGIGRQVVDSLHRRLPRAVLSRERYSSDPEAYNAYMAGLRESFSDQAGTLAIAAEHLSRAVERDPQFALAHATLSLVSMNIHFQFDPQRQWLQRAEDHCRLALALDPELPEGHLARAWILWSPAKNFQHADALAALTQVIASRPTLERAHNRMSTIYLHIGRLEDARIAHEQALRSNPRTRTGNLEYFYIYSGDFVRAEAAAEAWYRERPTNTYALVTRAMTALMSGRLDLAEERLASAFAHLPDEPLLVVLEGIVQVRRGRSEHALQCVRRALESPRSFGHTHHVHHHAACVYALLGDTTRAMAWLERAAEAGFPCWPFFRIDPHLANLRDQPAFIQLMADLEQTYSARTS